MTVAILWDDGRQWMGASGLRDVAANEPMTTGTALGLASISKTLTAGVVLQLVDEGKLSLDDRVAPLLPEFGLHPRMTVRHLLDHTSGLPDLLPQREDRPAAPAGARRDVDRRGRLALRAEEASRAQPAWIYSNANYLLLGELVEKVTGQPLAVEIRDRLLTPLGLEQAWYQAVEQPRAPGAVAYRVVTAAGRKRRSSRSRRRAT